MDDKTPEIYDELYTYQSNSIKEITKAMLAADDEMESIELNKKGNYGKYSDLTQMFNAIKPVYRKHGLKIVQPIINIRGEEFVYTTIYHAPSGEFIRGRLAIFRSPDGNMQKMGSAITYSRRYCLGSIVGVASDEDDDAQKIADDINKEQEESKKQISKEQLEKLNKYFDTRPEYKSEILNRYKVAKFDQLYKGEYEEIAAEVKSITPKKS